jgi:hypothetical protein
MHSEQSRTGIPDFFVSTRGAFSRTILKIVRPKISFVWARSNENEGRSRSVESRKRTKNLKKEQKLEELQIEEAMKKLRDEIDEQIQKNKVQINKGGSSRLTQVRLQKTQLNKR